MQNLNGRYYFLGSTRLIEIQVRIAKHKYFLQLNVKLQIGYT